MVVPRSDRMYKHRLDQTEEVSKQEKLTRQEVEETRTRCKLQRGAAKAGHTQPRALKLSILAWERSEKKKSFTSSNTNTLSQFYLIVVINTQAYFETLLLCTKYYTNWESVYKCLHAYLMSSKFFGYVITVRILEWPWHGKKVVYFLYVVDSSSNMLGKFFLGQWRIYM